MPYYRSFNFSLEIGGGISASFQECTGLSISTNVTEYREGTDGRTIGGVRKLPGIPRYGDITLRRGITEDEKLFDWADKISSGVAEYRNITISLTDFDGTAKVSWNLTNAFPRSWSGPSLNAMGEGLAIEQVVLAVEKVEKSQWSA